MSMQTLDPKPQILNQKVTKSKVVESDFAKNLAEMRVAEATAQAELAKVGFRV